MFKSTVRHCLMLQLAASLQSWDSPDGDHKPPCFFGTRHRVLRVPATTASQDAAATVFTVYSATLLITLIFSISDSSDTFCSACVFVPFAVEVGHDSCLSVLPSLKLLIIIQATKLQQPFWRATSLNVKTFLSLCCSSQSGSWREGAAIILFSTALFLLQQLCPSC